MEVEKIKIPIPESANREFQRFIDIIKHENIHPPERFFCCPLSLDEKARNGMGDGLGPVNYGVYDKYMMRHHKVVRMFPFHYKGAKPKIFSIFYIYPNPEIPIYFENEVIPDEEYIKINENNLFPIEQ